MASKRSKKRGSTKKKSQTKIVKPVISELNGFKLGEKIWYSTANGSIGFGKIDCFYPKDEHGPVVQVFDEINYGYRCGLLESASYDPPKGGKARLSRVKGREARDAVKKK